VPKQESQTTTACFVLCNNMLATSLALPLEMLCAARDFAKSKKLKHRIKIHSISDRPGPIKSRGGLPLYPDTLIENSEGSFPDLIFVPALWRNPVQAQTAHPALSDWLKQAANQGSTLCGVGTGVCFIAESGLLDDKPATTHWYYFDEFQKRYPKVILKRQHMITQADNIYCAGSINTLADLTVHFIQQRFGKTISSHVERHFSQEVRQPFEHMSFLHDQPSRHQDEDIIQAQLWLHDNYHQTIVLGDIAKNFDMSIRNFNRRFKAATNKTPLTYLQELRISNARDLLKKSNLSIAEIANRVGYSDVGHFTSLFKSITQVTPSEYRKTVRSKLFSLET